MVLLLEDNGGGKSPGSVVLAKSPERSAWRIFVCRLLSGGKETYRKTAHFICEKKNILVDIFSVSEQKGMFKVLQCEKQQLKPKI